MTLRRIVGTQTVAADAVKCCIYLQSKRIKCMGMPVKNVILNIFQCNRSPVRDSSRKIGINHFITEAERFKYSRALI